MGANLAGKIPSLSSNLASSILIKGIKVTAPTYSKFPHILVFFFVKPSRIIKISHKDPIIETSVGKRSLIINLSMIVTTSNIPERIANFVSILN